MFHKQIFEHINHSSYKCKQIPISQFVTKFLIRRHNIKCWHYTSFLASFRVLTSGKKVQILRILTYITQVNFCFRRNISFEYVRVKLISHYEKRKDLPPTEIRINFSFKIFLLLISANRDVIMLGRNNFPSQSHSGGTSEAIELEWDKVITRAGKNLCNTANGWIKNVCGWSWWKDLLFDSSQGLNQLNKFLFFNKKYYRPV